MIINEIMILHLLLSALLKVNGSQVVLQQLVCLQFVIALLMLKSRKNGESMCIISNTKNFHALWFAKLI